MLQACDELRKMPGAVGLLSGRTKSLKSIETSPAGNGYRDPLTVLRGLHGDYYATDMIDRQQFMLLTNESLFAVRDDRSAYCILISCTPPLSARLLLLLRASTHACRRACLGRPSVQP